VPAAAKATAGRARQFATVGAVVVTGFLCGWQATGVAGGAFLGVALGAGISPAVFRRRPDPPRRRLR